MFLDQIILHGLPHSNKMCYVSLKRQGFIDNSFHTRVECKSVSVFAIEGLFQKPATTLRRVHISQSRKDFLGMFPESSVMIILCKHHVSEIEPEGYSDRPFPYHPRKGLR